MSSPKKKGYMLIRNKDWFNDQYRELFASNSLSSSQSEAFLFQLIVAYFDKDISLAETIHLIRRIFQEQQETIRKPINTLIKQTLSYCQRKQVNKETVNNLLQNLLDLISFPKKKE